MKLIKIEDFPNQELWDIEVEDSHCFFANGILVHNSNAGLRFSKDGTLTPQSRERDLSLLSDNYGFASYVFKHEELWRMILSDIIGDNDNVVVFGEWCGQGIQSGVAVSLLPKTFIIFGLMFQKENDNDVWISYQDLNKYFPECINEKCNSYLITQFNQYHIDINFNHPQLVQNQLVELTNQVEHECPVGKHFGISGIGEGIVWQHYSDFGRFMFKVKGEKHQNSHVKVLAPIDEEAYLKCKDFAENFCTEARLEQGIFWLKSELQLEFEIKNIGHFIKWVVQDILKEEQNSIVQNDLNPKKVAQEISKIARNWYLQRY